MRFAQRILLFLLVNVLVMLTITAIFYIFHVPQMLGRTHYGGYGGYGYGAGYQISYGVLMVWCFLVGMGGSFISLALSRWMAKTMMGVRVIDPDTANPDARQLVDTVYKLAQRAGLEVMPEVGIYNSPEVNAFATGPSRSKALVSVSAGLLNNMQRSDVEGVLGHEIAHVANGDMVTMALIQGVVNAIVMFLAWVLSLAVSQGSSRDNDRGGNFFMQWMLMNLFQFIFGLFGMIVVAWFSRWREFRADAGGARYAGKDHMIGALKALERVHEQGADMIGQPHPAFQALKISGKTGGLMALFADHPPLEERIARLEQMK